MSVDLSQTLNVVNIESTFVRLLSAGLGILPIQAEQSDAPFPPSGTVSTVHFASSGTVGKPSRKYVSACDDLIETVTSVKRGVISINFFRDQDGNAVQFAEAFKDYLRTTVAKAELKRNGIGIVETSDTRNLSDVDKARWQSRAQVDVTIYASNQVSTGVEAINSANITGTVQSGFPITFEYEPSSFLNPPPTFEYEPSSFETVPTVIEYEPSSFNNTP